MQDIPYDASHVPIDYDEPGNVDEIGLKTASKRKNERRARRDHRAALEKDVAQLQKKLMIELNTRNALNRGLSRPLGSLPRIYGSLPVETRELLLEVAVLEEEIISLEKQIVHLGREIENEVPATDKETICHAPRKMLSPVKTGVLGSPVLSPKASARINSKPLASPRKSPDQTTNLSKSSVSYGKFTENRSSPSKVSMSPRNSLDHGNPVKSPTTLKDSSKPIHISTTGAPQKSQIHKNSLLPKVSVRNSRDFKSRKLSFTSKEPNGVHSLKTVPFISTNFDLPRARKESTPPVSPASGGPSEVTKGLPGKPPRTKTENGKPLMTAYAPLRRKDPPNNRSASAARTLKAASANKPPGQDKAPVDQAARTPRLPRQPAKHGTISTRRVVGASTASRKQKMDTQKTSVSEVRTTTELDGDSNPQSNLQEHFYADFGEDSSVKLDVEQASVHIPPDNAKGNPPVADTEVCLKQVSDSALLSEKAVKLLETIYESIQEKQPFMAVDSGSSQASTSVSISSASPDDYDLKDGAIVKFRLDGCHTESFRVKRTSSMKILGDCYPGELADTMDPFRYLSPGSISNRIDYHERLT